MAGKSALFVCLGNICRSPIAEACFKQLLEEQGMLNNWRVDSAGTSRYQIGDSPDERGQACMESLNIYHHVEHHRARQITKTDYEEFDFIFGMDHSNISNLKRMAPPSHKAKIFLLGSFDDDKSHNDIIEDPYYGGGHKVFRKVHDQCKRSCINFLKSEHVN